MKHSHAVLGEVDVYPVGVLMDLQALVRAYIIRDPRITAGSRAFVRRRFRRTLRRGLWNRNTWNGYLAEPVRFPDDGTLTRCGHGWTRRRALRDLDRARHEGMRP